MKEQLENMVAAGYGDLPIKLRDDVLHEDDFVFHFIGDGGMEINDMLYNNPQYQKIVVLKMDVEKIFDKFSGRAEKKL